MVYMQRLFYILSLFFISFTLLGQPKYQIEDQYKDANAYFYFEDFEEALALYLKIYEHYPNNSNIDYRIGLCYLNIPGQKHKAIGYLERAVQRVSRRYNENSSRELNAPLDAFFYLGNAYFINNQLDKAQKAYSDFQSQIRNERRYNMDFFQHQLEAIKNSRVMQRYPVNFLRSNLGPNFNNHLSNFNPVISGDGKTIAYTTKERFYQAIYVVRKEGNSWGKPRNITLDLVVNGNCTTLSLSYSGDEIFLFKDDDHVGNIYVSNFRQGKWTPMVKLNSNINTDFYETHASISADGKALFFASNRAGGYGDLDIYVSYRSSGGDWGPAQNLGSNINSSFNENTPFITNDGNTLFFSSYWHNTIGGYDIFFSQKQSDGTWSKPINLGYPINTTDDNMFYQPIGDGSKGLMALFAEDSMGEMDIYEIEIFLPIYQKSIISISDLYEKKGELQKTTLIIDTLKQPGTALLDPIYEEHQKYLSSNKNYTLFYKGRPFSIKDQTTFLEKIDIKLKPSLPSEKVIVTKPADIPISVATTEEIKEKIEEEISIPETKKPSEITVIDSVTIKDTLTFEQPSSTFHTEESKQSIETLTRTLQLLADSELKNEIVGIINNNLIATPSLVRLNSLKLSSVTDSLGKTYKYIEVFSKFFDLVSHKSSTNPLRKVRTISPTQDIDVFFYNLQVLKRKASNGLSEILDYTLISNPEINSFESLWSFLQTQQAYNIEPFSKELLTLLAEISTETYWNLTTDLQEAIISEVTKTDLPFRTTFIVSLLVVIGALAYYFWRRK